MYIRLTTTLIRWCVLVILGLALVLVIISFQQQNNLHDRVKVMQRYLQTIPQDPNNHLKDPYSAGSQPSHALQVHDQHTHVFDWEGYVFNKDGVHKEIVAEVQSSFIHSFSPMIEQDVALKFVDPGKENIFYANAPAIKWYNGTLVLVCRIWLAKERYLSKNNFPMNDFQDNYLYTQTFDASLKAISLSRILAIPINKKPQLGDGPIEPRLYVVKGKLYTTFNAAIMFPWGQKIDSTFIYDYNLDRTYVPEIKGGSPAVLETISGVPRDKHWMAFTQDDQLFFVHNLDPLTVMKCTEQGSCEFVHRQTFAPDFMFKRNAYIGRLRGGTPFELYSGNYYVSIAHSTLVTRLTHQRRYECHLVVLYASAKSSRYRIVYVSDSLKFDSAMYASFPNVRQGITEGFLFPVSLLIENPDSVVIGGHINDHSAVLVRVRGVRALMETVIEVDEAQEETHQKSPHPGFIRRHIRDKVQQKSGIPLLV